MLDHILVEIWLRTRDEATFRTLYRRHATVMWRLALRLCAGDKVAAEEIVQEAWMRAVRALPEFRWQSSLRTWLCGIVMFRWRETLRVRATAPAEHPVSTPDVPLRLDVEAAFAALPEPLRETLVLHDFEGYKHREIAAILGIAEGTSRSRLSEARTAFRSFFNN